MNRLSGFAACFGVLAAASLLTACSQQKTETAAAPPPAEAPAPAPAPAPEPTPAAEPAAPPAGAVKLEITDASGAQLSGDPAAGQKIFKQCQTCHSGEAGKNMIGPSLHSLIGRKAGTVPGFKYSNANKNSGITWTEQELYTYLEAPRKRIPGTLMSFPGLPKSQDRADVIAYLKTLS